jgi:hypothetical protein
VQRAVLFSRNKLDLRSRLARASCHCRTDSTSHILPPNELKRHYGSVRGGYHDRPPSELRNLSPTLQ